MKKKFICTVCGYIYEGTEAPEKCPICKAPASKFKIGRASCRERV